jgi:hypothetical protein
MTQSRPIYSRRNLLRSGGTLAAAGAVLAACGGAETHSIARIGISPTTVKLSDAEVTDTVLLRTAMSFEAMVQSMLSDSAVTSIAPANAKSVIAAFAASRTATLGALSSLVTARGAQPVSEPNQKLMQSYGNAALELLRSGKQVADALALTLALETLTASTYQYFVSLTKEPALRADMMRVGAGASRRAAVAAQLINGGTKAFGPGLDAEGVAILATLPKAFGPLNTVQVGLGTPNEVGALTTVLMDTPSINSFVY